MQNLNIKTEQKLHILVAITPNGKYFSVEISKQHTMRLTVRCG